MHKNLGKKILLIAYKRGYRINSKGEICFKGIKRISKSQTKGYYHFSIRIKISVKNVPKNVYIHRLQAYQKYGNKIFNKQIHVRHLNSNKRDNSKNNILIGTRSQNMMDRPKADRIRHAIKASENKRKINDEKAMLIRNDRNNGCTYKQLTKKYGISKSTLSYLFNKAHYYKKMKPKIRDAVS